MTLNEHSGVPAASMSDVKVLVTGATGFIGSHVARAFADAGAGVRGAVRQRGRALPSDVEPVVTGDITNAPALREAVRGRDVVIHAAGLAHLVGRDAAQAEQEYHRINAGGAQAALTAAIAEGCTCFVLISSVAADSPDNAYGRSKLAAENIVREMAAAAGIAAPILRPPLVYGPGMKGNPQRLMSLIRLGVPIPLGRADALRSMVFVRNLAAAAVYVAGRGHAANSTYYVTDGEDICAADFIRAAATGLGRSPHLLPVPPSLLYAAGAVGNMVSRITPFPLTTDALDRLFGEMRVDGQPLRDLGFQPPWTSREALIETGRWYRKD